MNLRLKLTIVLLAITLIPIFLVGVLSFYTAQNIISEHILEDLRAISSLQESRIEYVLHRDELKLKTIAQIRQILESLDDYYKTGNAEQKSKIENFLTEAVNIQPSFQVLSILDAKGKVIASTNNSLDGKNLSTSELYIKGREKSFLTFSVGANIQTSMPLLFHGNFLGVIIGESDNSKDITNIINDYSGLGNSGESFLVKDDGQGNAIFLMPRKFEKDPNSKSKIDKSETKVPAIHAISKEEITMNDAIDYRGVPVLAATRYLDRIDCGLIIKIDKDEALLPVYHLMTLILIIMGSTIFVILIVVFFITKSISDPIANLQKGAELISAGNLDYRIFSKSRDEIGKLSLTYNKMAESLKHKTTTIDNLNREIEAREKAEKGLREIEWLLTAKPKKNNYKAPYGNLTELNHSGLILSSLGEETLTNIVSEYLDLLETSAAVYEKNGDYALGIFSSGWCQFIDSASRRLCDTNDNSQALMSGKWECHKSCWNHASKKSIDTGEVVDIECFGGIHLFAVPIRASNKIIGSINVAYGNPPSDPQKLEEIAQKCKISIDKLQEVAKSYNPRPSFIIELAKQRLKFSAELIGALVERKETEKALQETSEYLQNLITYANAPIIVWDLQFRITQFNHAFELLTGRKASDVIGKTLEFLFPPALVERTMKLIQKTLTGERWDVVEIKIQHIDGSVHTVLWNSAAIFAADGKTILAVIAQGQDITERKNVEKANYQLASIVESSSDGIISNAFDGTIMTWNKGAEELFGYTESEIQGKSVLMLVPPEFHKETIEFIKMVREDEAIEQHEAVYIKKDGSEVNISLTISPIKNLEGEIIGSSLIIHDITKRVQAENKLKVIAWNLQEKSKELEEANKEMEAFSYSVSHDLRAPLRSILGFTELIQEDYSPLLDSKGKDFLDRVCSAAKRMDQLIEDMLKLAFITRTKIVQTTVDLSKEAEKIANRLKQSNPERSVDFLIEPDLKVTGDEHLLGIMLENLLSNAWKFTSKTPTAKIEFGLKHNEKEKVYFIRDNGAGFNMEYANKLFGVFQRLHLTEEFAGTGIGLTIVERIIKLHKGKIWAEAEVNKGATFYFILFKKEI